MLRLMDDAGPRQTLQTDPLRRARALIEANLAEPLSLEALAAAAGLSAYHFTRQFAARFGLSPMAFVRERRMALAAVRLTHQPPPALVDLAFDLGFESQEGFTRAFKRAYGVSPGRFRRAQNIYEETPVMTEIATSPRLAMEPAPVKKPGFHVAGLWPALIASLVIGLLNATVGLFLKIITFPISILTLGLFLLVINGLMILFASSIVRGFQVRGFVPAFWGAIVLALLGMLIKAVVKDS